MNIIKLSAIDSTNDYLKINNYKKNTISYIVKDFLNKNIKEQLELIVLCLLIDK